MRDAFVCDYIRTPIGRFGGALAAVRPDDLGAVPLMAPSARNGQLDWEAVGDVILGNANGAGEDNRNVARMSLLLAGPAGWHHRNHHKSPLRLRDGRRHHGRPRHQIRRGRTGDRGGALS